MISSAMLRWSLIALASLAAIAVVGIASVIAFGTKAAPPPMTTILPRAKAS